MIVTYSPDGQEPQTWHFVPKRLRESRIEMMEKRFAKLIGEDRAPFDVLRMELMQDGASARRVVLWELLNREHPLLKIEDVDPVRDELTVQQTKQELAEFRDSLAKMAESKDDPKLALALADIDRRIEEAPDDADGGKARSKSSKSATG